MCIPDDVKSGLVLILYELYHFDAKKDFPAFEGKVVEYFCKYPEEKRRRIFNSLAWAKGHPNFSFNSILPRQSRYTNSEVLKFLEYIHAGFTDSGLVVKN